MNATEPSKAKTFDETHCWDGLAGADCWHTDEANADAEINQPLYRDLTDECFAVADAAGVGLHFIIGDDSVELHLPNNSDVDFRVDLAFPNQAVARLFVDALPQDMTIERAKTLGFVEF
jgi:hypothetical protein